MSESSHHPSRSAGRAAFGACSPRRSLLRLLVAALCTISATTLAGGLEVRVLARTTGQPIQGASICLGTPAEPIQLGGEQSGADGRALFPHLPNAPLVLIVSKKGFSSYRLPVSGAPRNLDMLILLSKGAQGPYSCQLPTPSPGPEQRGPGLEIPTLAINSGARSTNQRLVRLDIAAPAGANQFRASESAEFAEAEWRPLEASPRFELSPGPGRKRVYVQVRRLREIEGASLETRSKTASDDILLD